jgi:5-methylcytosine-specific restriction endonuclease McrA
MKRKVKFDSATKCYICGSKEKLVNHHIQPLEYGGKDKLRNIITLCSNCHIKQHTIINKHWRKKRQVSQYLYKVERENCFKELWVWEDNYGWVLWLSK